jgi:hypothetical protein
VIDRYVYDRFDKFMGSLKTFLITLLVLPAPCRGVEGSLVETFATCAGRFSAEMEHAWLMSDERSAEFERDRANFLALLDAITPLVGARDALRLRIDAKVAHASLLKQATFSQNAERVAWAHDRADAEIRYCSSHILGS